MFNTDVGSRQSSLARHILFQLKFWKVKSTEFTLHMQSPTYSVAFSLEMRKNKNFAAAFT